MQHPARNAIENMNIGVDRLSPKLKRHGESIEHTPGAFNNAHVVPLNNGILRRRVRSGELMANAFKLDKSLKVFR